MSSLNLNLKPSINQPVSCPKLLLTITDFLWIGCIFKFNVLRLSQGLYFLLSLRCWPPKLLLHPTYLCRKACNWLFLGRYRMRGEVSCTTRQKVLDSSTCPLHHFQWIRLAQGCWFVSIHHYIHWVSLWAFEGFRQLQSILRDSYGFQRLWWKQRLLQQQHATQKMLLSPYLESSHFRHICTK